MRDYGVPLEKIEVIPPGVDIDRWRPQPALRSAPGQRVQLLFVGGHFERKGGRLLVEAFQALGLGDHADLHIVTREPVDSAPGIVVHHNLDNNSPELMRLYQSADLFALPTLADCFSLASIEAMAAGLPVITTAMGGIPDIVADGDTGYLVPPGDPRALAHALRSLVDDPARRTRFGIAARDRAVSRFNARTSAARILALAEAAARPLS